MAASKAALEARKAVRSANVRAKEQARAAIAASEEWHVKRRMTKEKARREAREMRKTSSRQSAVGLLALFAIGFLGMVGMSVSGEGRRPRFVVYSAEGAPSPQELIPVQSEGVRSIHEQLIGQRPTDSKPLRGVASVRGGEAPQVLLLSERPLVAGVDAERRLAFALEQELGWRVLGEEGTLPRNGSELDLLARVRSTAGLSSLGDSAASKRLVELIERRDDLDAIVWFGVDEDEDLQVELLLPRNTAWGGGQQARLGAEGNSSYGAGQASHQLAQDLRGLDRDLKELFEQIGSNQVLRQALEPLNFEGDFEIQFKGLKWPEDGECFEGGLFDGSFEQECGGSLPTPFCRDQEQPCREEPSTWTQHRLIHAG